MHTQSSCIASQLDYTIDYTICLRIQIVIMKPLPPALSFPALVNTPLLTVSRFAELVGLDVGVCEAQADRKLWPIVRIGKRRFINVEILRQRALREGNEASS